jgi:hypothetical protein
MRRRRPTALAGLRVALGAVLVAAGAGGCASTPRGADVTGGLVVQMHVESAGRAYELYRVETDGTLRFAGGYDARNEKYTWSGPLTGDEIARLRAIVAEHRWLEDDPASVAEPPDRLYRIRVRRGSDRASFMVTGDSPAVKPAYDLLRTAGERRLDEFMETLPEPGHQTQ